MINEILSAIYSRLRADSTLTGLLAASVGGGSAVYSGSLVPGNAVLPYIAINGPISDVPDDTFDAQYRGSLWDIHCYDHRPDGGGGSVARVNSIAERVRTLLHRQPLTLAGDPRNLVCAVEMVSINDDSSAFGRVVQLRLLTGA